MKNLGKQIQILALCAVTTLFVTACGEQKSKTEDTTTTTTEETTIDTASETTMDTAMAGGGMMAHMHQNMQEMQGMQSKMTGDPDHDFAQMMIMHHQGAVRMADDEIANGTDSNLKQMAKKTKDSNQAEIQKLQDFTSKHKPTTGDTATTMKMMHSMQSMMGEMHQQDMSNMNTDQSFAQMMIQHHQMGIDMTKAYLGMSKNQQLKQKAQQTMEEQTKEIKELETWLRKQPK